MNLCFASSTSRALNQDVVKMRSLNKINKFQGDILLIWDDAEL